MASNYFRLKSLNINGYKNIQNLDIDFTNKNNITILIGNNGCGKSNVLEALSSIFAGLYENKIHKPQFNYSLTYNINSKEVDIKLINDSYTFIVDGNILSKTDFHNNAKVYLPTNVIACYSGECQRLWDGYYSLYYKRYISNLKASESVPELPMLYINRYNIEISLITLFFYDFEAFTDIRDFCCKTLNIQSIEGIDFYYDVKKVKEWKDNAVLKMIQQFNKIEDFSILSATKCSLSLDEFKEQVGYMQERELFKNLYAASMPKKDKVITKIGIKIKLNNNEIIDVDDLSEGEKKYLLMKVILETLADENSLLLFDEPDSHIHISRKAELKNLFEKYENRENIITTHSPTLAVALEDHLQGLSLDAEGHTVTIDGNKSKIVSQITGGMWNIQEQNIFLSSSKPITLLVEGKTDKMHIEEAFKRLKKDYPNLDFDVFSMNSSEHIREVLIGLSCSGIEWKKKYIGIFDNDQAGQRDISNGFEKEPIDEQIKHVKHKDAGTSKNFYAFLIPKAENHNDSFTIENCYPPERYQEAFNEALEAKQGHFAGLSIDKVAEDLKNKSKILLAEKSHTFNDEEFDSFKPIFDIIAKINSL